MSNGVYMSRGSMGHVFLSGLSFGPSSEPVIIEIGNPGSNRECRIDKSREGTAASYRKEYINEDHYVCSLEELHEAIELLRRRRDG